MSTLDVIVHSIYCLVRSVSVNHMNGNNNTWTTGFFVLLNSETREIHRLYIFRFVLNSRLLKLL